MLIINRPHADSVRLRVRRVERSESGGLCIVAKSTPENHIYWVELSDDLVAQIRESKP